jgi:hypothetical protein
MHYNFVKEFKQHLVAVKIDQYGRHMLLDIPFYGGHLRLDFEVRDGFFMHVTGTACVINDFRAIDKLSIEFGTADVMAEKVAEVLNELERETREARLGLLTVKKILKCN